MKNWYNFYKDNVIAWDLMVKLPSVGHKKSHVTMDYFPKFTRVVLALNLRVNNESDFKIIKSIRFFLDLFLNIPVKLKVVKRQLAKGRSDRGVSIVISCYRDSLVFFLESLSTYLLRNILKKQVPLSYGIDSLGIVRLELKDLGELGIPMLYYDYFGWASKLNIAMFTSKTSIGQSNLVLSYLNFKF